MQAIMEQLLTFAATPNGIAATLLLLIFTWLGWRPFLRYKYRHIPGPFALPFLGNIPSMVARDITPYLDWVSERYGPVAKVWMGARPWIIISDVDACRKLAFKTTARPPSVGSFSHLLHGEPLAVDRESILWNRDASWRAARRAFEASIIHPARLAGHLPAVRRCVDRAMASLASYAANGQPLDAKKLFAKMSLATVGEVAYGLDFWVEGDTPPSLAAAAADPAAPPAAVLLAACLECLECLELDAATNYLPLQLMFPTLHPLWSWLAAALPDAKQRRHMAARQKVADVSRQLMANYLEAKRNGNGNGNGSITGSNGAAGGGGGGGFGAVAGGCGISGSSFLASMLDDVATAAATANGDGNGDDGASGRASGDGGVTGAAAHMSEIQAISQCLTFILAGFDTTSNGLAFAAYLLAAHPEVASRLRAELDGAPAELSVEALDQLPYLDAVFRETMRLHPPVGSSWRDVVADIRLDVAGGVVIPGDTFAWLNNHCLQHDPKVWAQPHTFLPQRWLPEGAALGLAPSNPAAYTPFGQGTRLCVGHKLATLASKLALAALVRTYDLELHSSQEVPIRVKTGITLRPERGVWVTVRQRGSLEGPS